MKVKDCMTQNVYCVKPDTTLNDIAKLMEDTFLYSMRMVLENNI